MREMGISRYRDTKSDKNGGFNLKCIVFLIYNGSSLCHTSDVFIYNKSIADVLPLFFNTVPVKGNTFFY